MWRGYKNHRETKAFLPEPGDYWECKIGRQCFNPRHYKDTNKACEFYLWSPRKHKNINTDLEINISPGSRFSSLSVSAGSPQAFLSWSLARNRHSGYFIRINNSSPEPDGRTVVYFLFLWHQ